MANMIRARKEGRRAKAPAPIKMPLFNLTVNRDADSRVDKYRANVFCPTSLYHANLQDAGDHPIPVIAKVKIILNDTSPILLSCKMRTFKLLGLHHDIHNFTIPKVSYCFATCHQNTVDVV